MTQKTTYIGTYKVFKVFRKSQRRVILRRGLTKEQAMLIVNRYESNNKSMVCFDKQFYADKYFI